jgi:hypothetical protein
MNEFLLVNITVINNENNEDVGLRRMLRVNTFPLFLKRPYSLISDSFLRVLAPAGALYMPFPYFCVRDEFNADLVIVPLGFWHSCCCRNA